MTLYVYKFSIILSGDVQPIEIGIIASDVEDAKKYLRKQLDGSYSIQDVQQCNPFQDYEF